MKKSATYCCLFILMLSLYACTNQLSEIPSLKESYSKNDKNPFGGYVFFKQATQLFQNNDIRIRKDKVETSLLHFEDTGALYINVSKNYFVGEQGLDAVKSFVEKGNNMFIASENFDSSFLDFLGVTIAPKSAFMVLEDMQYTSVRLNIARFFDSTRYAYFYVPFKNHFITVADSSIQILGMNENGKPNFLVKFFGRGRFFIHCEPRAFSNYFLLQRNNYNYLQQALSFVPAEPEHVIWDDYYNKRYRAPSANDNKTGLAVLLQFPAMAWAFGLLIALLVLYLLFGSKRRQRVMEELPPNINTSVAFAETVSRLYLQKKDNKGIADKMITYFFEHIRTQYFLNTSQVNDSFVDTLSRKSNVSFKDTEKLFAHIQHIQESYTISDQELLLLNQQIESFYKTKT